MSDSSGLLSHFALAPADLAQLLSPSLLISREGVQQNLAEMIRIAGRPDRLWPHCKTHKIREIIQLAVEAGVRKHKCATIAEAEMLATCGATDIFWAYQPVGPNIARIAKLMAAYPQVRFYVALDSAEIAVELGKAISSTVTGKPASRLGVFLDIDCGQHRTGFTSSEAALHLARTITSQPALFLEGLHAYDGHNHQQNVEERRVAVLQGWELAKQIRDALASSGFPCKTIVAGGTGSFPIWASLQDPALELSPGTPILYDDGYRRQFPDLAFKPAAALLTRVVSRPLPQRITLDLGYKAVAADGPLPTRAFFPELPEAQLLMHNEEHLVLELPHATDIPLGKELLAIPKHICPTTALHKEVYVIDNQQCVGTWEVAARDRKLSI